MRLLSDTRGDARGLVASGHPRVVILLAALAALALTSGCSLWSRQEDSSRGQKLFTNLCFSTNCHGAHGDQVNGVRLFSKRFLETRTEESLFKLISGGARAMLPSSKENGGSLSEADIKDLIAYLKANAGASSDLQAGAESITSAAGMGSSPSPSERRPKKGLALNEIYFKYCVVCHKEDGFGVPSVPLGYRGYVSALGQDLLAKAISQGKDSMPAWAIGKAGALSEPEIAGLAAFILSVASDLPPTFTLGKATATPEPPSPAGRQTQEGASGSETTGKPQPQPAQVRSGKPPPPIPHGILGMEDRCLQCHARGGLASFPIGHTGRDVEWCARCHEPAPRPAPPLPHALSDRAGKCLICHGRGSAASRIPMDHVGRSLDGCLFCHGRR